MDLGLKGKTAFVAASSKGLGKAVAYEFAKEGCQVIINGRNDGALEAAKAYIEKETGIIPFIQKGDLTVENDRNQIIRTVLNKYTGIDILVTNTGGPPPGSFDKFRKKDWDQAYELLLGSAVGLLYGFLPAMKERKWGRIIAITSRAVKEPVPNLILSNSVRASVAGLMKTLSTEVAPFGITVNSVLPGYTDTERLQQLIKANPGLKESIKGVPVGRMGRPEEFAAAVSFLASERAGYITGISLPVDGGSIQSLF